MFWKVTCESADGGRGAAATALSAGDRVRASKADVPDAAASDGRFVLHRHRDGDGLHLDLRLEQDGHLMGWRIAGEALEGKPWATEKAPHPLRWLEQDGDALREDAGVYAWVERRPDCRAVLLRGNQGPRLIRFEALSGMSAPAMRSVSEALEKHTRPGGHGPCVRAGVDAGMAGQLVADGVTARRRAIERFCGLGRELDGAAFEEAVWRKTLEHLTLDEIHAQLRAYEVRFDAKYPPAPVSRPERLGDVVRGDAHVAHRGDAARRGDALGEPGESGNRGGRLDAAWAILRE